MQSLLLVSLTILYLVNADCTCIHSHLKAAVQDRSIYCNPPPGNGLSQMWDMRSPVLDTYGINGLGGISFFLLFPAG